MLELENERNEPLALAIAARAAARALPVRLSIEIAGGATRQSLLRCLMGFSGIAFAETVKFQSPYSIEPSTTELVNAANAVWGMYGSDGQQPLFQAVTIAAEAHNEAVSAMDVKSPSMKIRANAIQSAIEAILLARNSASNETEFWDDVLVDISELQRGGSLELRPLFRDRNYASYAYEAWSDLAEKLLSIKSTSSSSNSEWQFWVSWYERLLAGQDQKPQHLASIFAKIHLVDWQVGPPRINPMFDEVLGLYRAEDYGSKSIYGLKAAINGKKQTLDVVEVAPLDVSDVVDKLMKAFREFNRDTKRESKTSNLAQACKDAIDQPIADLKKLIKKHANEPAQLHYELKRFERKLPRIVEARMLSPSAALQSLLDDVRDMEVEICRLSEVVRDAEQERHAIALGRASNEQLLLAVRNCAGLATDGAGQMKVFATIAMKALADPATDPQERQLAWQFASIMAAQSAVLIKNHEQKVGEAKSSFGKNLKDASDLLVAGDKAVDVVQEAINEVSGSTWFDAFLNLLGQNPDILDAANSASGSIV